MSTEVAWWVELEIVPDRVESFRRLSAEMVAFARTEPGVLIYERFLDPHADTAYIYERYADSDAAIAHLKRFAERFAARFHDLVRRRRFIVMGDASPALRSILAPFGAIQALPVSA